MELVCGGVGSWRSEVPLVRVPARLAEESRQEV